MRPISELRTTDLRGVFSDVDDTLTEHGVVVPEAYTAIARARAAGLRVVLVTGRPGGWAEVLASLWPIDAAIAENGGLAFFKRDGRVHRLDFDPVDHRARLAQLAEVILRELSFARRSDDSSLRMTDVAFDVGELQKLPPEQIAAIVARCRALGATTLVSSVHAHAFFHAGDKARMAARVGEVLWSEPPEEIAARYAFVGDSPNDQAAFTFFATSIGVANVARFLAQLDPAPRYVTKAACGHGFAEAIDALLRSAT